MHSKRDKSEGSRFARRVQERQGTVDSLKSSVRHGTPKNLQFDRLLEQSNYEIPFHIQGRGGRVSKFLMPKNVIDKHLDIFDGNRYLDFDRVDAALAWTETSGLWQVEADSRDIIGGWIDWQDPAETAPSWQRFIDTSAYYVMVATGGYDFSIS